MAKLTEKPEPKGCDDSCRLAPSIEALNRMCYCLSLDEEALRRGLETDLDMRGLSRAMVETHPYLFAALPVFVARNHLEHMARVIDAVERVVETPVFRRAAMAFIDYALPDGSFSRWLGRLFGNVYARWCTRRMADDAAMHFHKRG